MDKKDLQLAIAYNCWANEKILKTVSKLPVEHFEKNVKSSFGSIMKTLIHIFETEQGWLQICKESSGGEKPDETFESIKSLEQKWLLNNDDFQAYVDSLAPNDAKKIVAYHNASGKEFRDVLEHLIQHVVNHSTYHRGQITTLLRQIEAETVNTDFLAFVDENPHFKRQL